MKAYAGEAQTMVLLKLVLLAGFCGGMAEVLWIAVYGSLFATNSTEVARQVTASVFPAAANLAWAPVFGVITHLVLSLVLGLVITWMVWIPVTKRFSARSALSSAVAALIAVWAFNFFVVLPALNPDFTTLMPLCVTFVSKVLFGIAMAAVLQKTAGTFDRETAVIHAA